jgi:hypothetical protein
MMDAGKAVDLAVMGQPKGGAAGRRSFSDVQQLRYITSDTSKHGNRAP